MNRNQDILNTTETDQFGQSAAALLHQGSQSLPAGIKDRLYAARLKALSVQKPEKVRIQEHVLTSTSGNWSSGSRSFWDNVGWVAPLVVLVFGMIGIAQWQQDSRINDIAELDAALLTDDVPPDAYADSGFMGFLKNGPLAESDQDSLDSTKSPS
ncbi:MAG: hypothetical protein B7Y05_06320 [Polynucleobacter sp. 24-46-87]|uniref:DUF3619 family protein n=1 Tax=unclassified Polynucleobacter TaxID=2640945 RepID=UPI000BDDB602|nr:MULTISPECIES: DUF3619 family protein [unclassified Polynucleobacter]OYY15293.1 MAG: hypothetical protein B7Y67_10025 [Polynucleobacter sp. 35-46-11]OZA14788.1 MAG: hypothetical protein B7Y05_06320 [Polynucleobacter sp. 24-46-87]OZA76388.1 MAG: hypothetical protein B7X71_08595 [Polynucleobacter sp. 39-46-10]